MLFGIYSFYYINIRYYSFKIFPRFSLVKTTRIIHLNQLLLLQIIEPLAEKPGTRLCYFWWAEKQRAHFLPWEFENIFNK